MSFLKSIRLINSNLASVDGNIIKRFTSVAMRVLLLEDGLLEPNLQKKLDEMKQTISDGISFPVEIGNMNFEIKELKKVTTKRFINLLLEFENSINDEFINAYFKMKEAENEIITESK